ncbi:hypothetical protein PRIPAC_81856 [Pristionchus pacificus]|uniref:Uncharacterized protein n=1 Tax=Pristionchus pacificus TaxID=54126 RepID=A0A2A6C3D2_PRIPA|nr:hypothetical protein PRIPAC_81856 [Pristionchus pacificus]|eukprot:PDM72685.1 hypothetical protein PRIPAC_39119 [Pristionchus pacificus]
MWYGSVIDLAKLMELLRVLAQATTAQNVEGWENESYREGILCDQMMGQKRRSVKIIRQKKEQLHQIQL